MTYEHARQTAAEFTNGGIEEGYCQMVALDGILRHQDVPAKYWRQVVQHLDEDNVEAVIDTFDVLTDEIFGENATNFKKRLQELFDSEYPAASIDYTIEPGNPFVKEPEDAIAIPKHQHEYLQRFIEDNPAYAQTQDAAIRNELRAQFEERASFAIVLENALDEGMTVVCKVGGDDYHAVGIMREGDAYYVVDHRWEGDSKNRSVQKLGPYTVLQLTGYDPFSADNTYQPEVFEPISKRAQEDGSYQYHLTFFPPEPR